EAANHGIKGARGYVELTEGAAAQRRHVLDAELADRVGSSGQPADRPPEHPAKQEGDQQSRQSDTTANGSDEDETPDRRIDVLQAYVEADQPGNRSVGADFAIKEDVGVLRIPLTVSRIAADADDAPGHVAVTEDVLGVIDRWRPHGRQHIVADLVQV